MSPPCFAAVGRLAPAGGPRPPSASKGKASPYPASWPRARAAGPRMCVGTDARDAHLHIYQCGLWCVVAARSGGHGPPRKSRRLPAHFGMASRPRLPAASVRSKWTLRASVSGASPPYRPSCYAAELTAKLRNRAPAVNPGRVGRQGAIEVWCRLAFRSGVGATQSDSNDGSCHRRGFLR